MSVCDRHRLVDLRDMCGTVSLAAHLTARRLRWFGHVVRMDEGRIPQVALYSTLHGVTKRPRGRPPMKWQACVFSDLQQQELPTKMGDLQGCCFLRGPWRSMVYRITHPNAVGVSFQRSQGSFQRQQQQQQLRQQQLLPQPGVAAKPREPVMIAGLGWLCGQCGRMHPTRECSQTFVSGRALSD